MNLNQVPQSDYVLVDANIFMYAVLHRSEQCMQLLRRCSRGDVVGITGSQQIMEVMHRLMVIEAHDNGWTSGGNPVRSLAARPDRVQLLSRYAEAIKGLLASGIRYETVRKEDILSALAIQRQYGLMTNDATLVAIGERLRVQSIASADSQFHSVTAFRLYSPDDLADLS